MRWQTGRKMEEKRSNRIEKKIWIQAGITLAFLLLLLYGAASPYWALGARYYSVTMEGKHLGNVSCGVDVEELVHENRRELANQTEGYLMLDLDYEVQEKSRLFQPLISEQELSQQIEETMAQTHETQDNQLMYMIWAGDTPIYFSSMDELTGFLEKIKDQQDAGNNYQVVYESGEGHKDDLMLARLEYSDSAEQLKSVLDRAQDLMWDALFVENDTQDEGMSGVLDLDFMDTVKVYTEYLPADKVSDEELAYAKVTKSGQRNTIYQVKEGDTLSSIAQSLDTTVESIMELNGYQSEEEALKEGNHMIVAVPQAEIGLRVVKALSYEENYTVKNEYINNEEWYRSQQVVRSVGTPGQRQVDVIITMENGVETDHEVVAQTIHVAATPTVIERGIRNPDTFIRPVEAVITSTFGERWGRMHEGIDFGCPEGTPVKASLGGVVTYSGWINGYGECIVIDHQDGTSTRYAHNSELLVEAGQTVIQGEIIALSGNTGNSTGPHVHFEIIIDGEPVDPLEYLP